MPQGDRTGPLGQGSMTGRALGFCNGDNTPDNVKGFGGGRDRGFGFGRGRSFGMGRGFSCGRSFRWPFFGNAQGFPFHRTMTKDDELNMLKSQAEALYRTQKDIEKRISELETQSK